MNRVYRGQRSSEVFQFRFQDRAILCLAFVRCGDVLRANMRPDRAPADNSEGLSVFRLMYSDEEATRLVVDDIW